MIGIVIILVISILVYRLAVRTAFLRSSGNAGEASFYTAITAAFLNLAAILLLERVYRKIAGEPRPPFAMFHHVFLLSFFVIVFVLFLTFYCCFYCLVVDVLVSPLMFSLSDGCLFLSVVFLTEWENHRRDSKFISALTVKIFMFQFMNNYCITCPCHIHGAA